MILSQKEAYERASFYREDRMQVVKYDIISRVNKAIEDGKYSVLIEVPNDFTVTEIDGLLEPYAEQGYYVDNKGHTLMINWEE